MADVAMQSPFAVLTAIVAPAILTNACSVLSLGTANRIARVVDRTRTVMADMHQLPQGPYRANRESQLARLQQRASYLVRALRLFYAALGSFAFAALATVVGSGLAYYQVPEGFHVAVVMGVTIGVYAVVSLVYGCSLLVRETRVALAQLGSEVDAELVLRPTDAGS